MGITRRRVRVVLVCAALSAAFTAPALAQTDPVGVFRQAIDARNRGDLAGTMAEFADDAVRQDGTCPTGCVGAEAIAQSVEQNFAEHFQATVLDARADGDLVTALTELRSDVFRARGAERVISSYTVELRGGKIVRWASSLDTSDPQTAAFLALQRQPAPAPAQIP